MFCVSLVIKHGVFHHHKQVLLITLQSVGHPSVYVTTTETFLQHCSEVVMHFFQNLTKILKKCFL